MTDATSVVTANNPDAILCLVTRPVHQSKPLMERLYQAGMSAISFPSIAIRASTQDPRLPHLNETLSHTDIALFVSRNAVDFTFKHLDQNSLPDTLQWGVIGKGTWQALRNHGVETQIIPSENYNSEGLLASDTLQKVTGKRIIIFRGQQGRNLLGDTLRQRGASVEYIEVYQRVLPEYTENTFDRLTHFHFPDIALFTSSEGMHNCMQLLSQMQAQALRNIPWLLISERMRETAVNLGHNAEIIIAASASDEGILQALKNWQHTSVNHH